MRLGAWMLATASLAAWATSVAASPNAGASHVLVAVDLRVNDPKGEVAALRSLWRDRLGKASEERGLNKPLPAFTLSHMFDAAQPKVFVSILFDMIDCELPGNGAGADLYARCPMRIVTGTHATPRIKTVEGVCNLDVTPAPRAGEGPDPSSNYTTVSLDDARVLHLRVVQFGKPVAGCNADIKVD